MATGKSYKQIVQESIDRTRARMETETDPQRLLIQRYYIMTEMKYTKRVRRRKGDGKGSPDGGYFIH